MLHCAAGLHRTGISGYCLLRFSGLHPAAAHAGLATMRQVTHDEVGEWRLRLADDIIVNWALQNH